MRENYGKANCCESRKCTGKSKVYDWALIQGKRYIFKRKNFKQLCRVCHIRYDFTKERTKNLRLSIKKTWFKRLGREGKLRIECPICKKMFRRYAAKVKGKYVVLCSVKCRKLSRFKEANIYEPRKYKKRVR